MPKQKTKTTKGQLKRPKSDNDSLSSRTPRSGTQKENSWFFERKAPDLPYWIFLVLVVMALTVFATWLQKPSAVNPIKSPPTSPTSPTPPTSLIKTVTISDAADPSLVAQNNKLYLTFRNNTGGYSVAVYDENLKELEAPRWITNGMAIPNQVSAKHIFVGQNWYLGYIGGDGFVRLAKYDQDFNRQREITFSSKGIGLFGKDAYLDIHSGYDPANHITISASNPGFLTNLVASTDLGILDDKDFGYRAQKENTLGGSWILLLDSKDYRAEVSGTSVTLKLYQR